MRKLIHLFILSVLAGGVAAQSDVQYTHFTFNKLAYNPGYTGAKGSFDALALYRNQWSGIDGAPRTIHVNAHTPFAGKRNGLGIALTSDEIGKVSTNSVDLSYAYRIKLGESSTLSISVAGRLEQLRFKWSEATPISTRTTRKSRRAMRRRLPPTSARALIFWAKNTTSASLCRDC